MYAYVHVYYTCELCHNIGMLPSEWRECTLRTGLVVDLYLISLFPGGNTTDIISGYNKNIRGQFS